MRSATWRDATRPPPYHQPAIASLEECAFRDHPERGPEPEPEPYSDGAATPWPALVGFIGLALLLVAANAAAIPAASHGWYLSLPRPPGAPTAGLIVAAFAILSPPSGLAAWLVWRGPANRRALLLWGWHLFACAAWMQCLLGLRLPGTALVAAAALLAVTIGTTIAFSHVRRLAGLLLLPSLCWTCYAAYITAGIWWLYRG